MFILKIFWFEFFSKRTFILELQIFYFILFTSRDIPNTIRLIAQQKNIKLRQKKREYQLQDWQI